MQVIFILFFIDSFTSCITINQSGEITANEALN